MLDGSVVGQGSGPVAPVFDIYDFRVEAKRGAWLEVDERSWAAAYALLGTVENEFPQVRRLLIDSRISYGNEKGTSQNMFVDADGWQRSQAILVLAAESSGWGEEAYRRIEAL